MLCTNGRVAEEVAGSHRLLQTEGNLQSSAAAYTPSISHFSLPRPCTPGLHVIFGVPEARQWLRAWRSAKAVQLTATAPSSRSTHRLGGERLKTVGLRLDIHCTSPPGSVGGSRWQNVALPRCVNVAWPITYLLSLAFCRAESWCWCWSFLRAPATRAAEQPAAEAPAATLLLLLHHNTSRSALHSAPRSLARTRS